MVQESKETEVEPSSLEENAANIFALVAGFVVVFLATCVLEALTNFMERIDTTSDWQGGLAFFGFVFLWVGSGLAIRALLIRIFAKKQ